MKVEVKKSASKSLSKIPGQYKIKISQSLLNIEGLRNTSEILYDSKLKGRSDRYKIRIGSYRIIYKEESETHILITAISHRKDVYKKLFGISLSL